MLVCVCGVPPLEAQRVAAHSALAESVFFSRSTAAAGRVDLYFPHDLFDAVLAARLALPHPSLAVAVPAMRDAATGAAAGAPSPDDVCAICLESLSPLEAGGALLRTLRCGHHFHGPCIAHWVGHTPRGGASSCPVCRADVLDKPP
jgi:hypothetical protein